MRHILRRLSPSSAPAPPPLPALLALVALGALLAPPAASDLEAQRAGERREARPVRPAPVPPYGYDPRAWPGDLDPYGREAGFDARRAAVERWHAERRAWLEAQREGYAEEGWDDAWPAPRLPGGRAESAAAARRVGPGQGAAPGRAGARPQAPGAYEAGPPSGSEGGRYEEHGDEGAGYGPDPFERGYGRGYDRYGARGNGYGARGYGAYGSGWYDPGAYGAYGAYGGYRRDAGRLGRHGARGSAFCLGGFDDDPWTGFGRGWPATRYDEHAGALSRCAGYGYGGFGYGGYGYGGYGYGGYGYGGYGYGSYPYGAYPYGAYPYGALGPAAPFPWPVPHRFDERFHPDEAPAAYPPFGAAPVPRAPGGAGVGVLATPLPPTLAPALAARDCAVVVGATALGGFFRTPVRLSAWRAASPAALRAILESRLAAAAPVTLRGLDGVDVRVGPGGAARVRVEPCRGAP